MIDHNARREKEQQAGVQAVYRRRILDRLLDEAASAYSRCDYEWRDAVTKLSTIVANVPYVDTE